MFPFWKLQVPPSSDSKDDSELNIWPVDMWANCEHN
jgi:hypothetical protein